MSAIEGVQPFILPIHFGEEYLCTIAGKVIGKYRPFCCAWHQRRCQEEVIYQGLSGADKGRWFACTLDDWATRFSLIEKKEEKQPEQEPATDRGPAGYKSDRPGY